MSGAGLAVPVAVLAVGLAAANPDSAALTQLGLAGEWAVDCQKPLGDDNPHVTFAAPGDQPPQYIESGAQGPVGAGFISNVRALSGGQIALTLTVTENFGGQSSTIVMNNVVLKDGNRFRFFEVKTGDGRVSVSGGVEKTKGEATKWLQKCGG
jgi:hypothetical protein